MFLRCAEHLDDGNEYCDKVGYECEVPCTSDLLRLLITMYSIDCWVAIESGCMYHIYKDMMNTITMLVLER